MKRVPKMGDTVLVVTRSHGHMVKGGHTTTATVTKIGRRYFYCKENTGGLHVFDTESFVNGHWCDIAIPLQASNIPAMKKPVLNEEKRNRIKYMFNGIIELIAGSRLRFSQI